MKGGRVDWAILAPAVALLILIGVWLAPVVMGWLR